MSSRKGQRDAARVVREQLARERRRQRTIWVSAAAVVVLVIAGLIGWAVWSSQRSDDFTTPPGANAAGTGIVTGARPGHRRRLRGLPLPGLQAVRADQRRRPSTSWSPRTRRQVVYHPVAYLNRFSTTEYSTRSSAASGCAAAGGKFHEYAKALFAQQPPEGSAGLSDDELIDIGTSVGLDRDCFGCCVKDGTYRTVDRARHRGGQPEPTSPARRPSRSTAGSWRTPPRTRSPQPWRRPASDPYRCWAAPALVAGRRPALVDPGQRVAARPPRTARTPRTAPTTAPGPPGSPRRGPGSTVRVIEAGARLELTNRTGRTIEVHRLLRRAVPAGRPRRGLREQPLPRHVPEPHHRRGDRAPGRRRPGRRHRTGGGSPTAPTARWHDQRALWQESAPPAAVRAAPGPRAPGPGLERCRCATAPTRC